MNEHIERIIDIGFSSFLLVMAITVFFTSNYSVESYKSSQYTDNRLYSETNDHSTYNDFVTGGDVILTILNDDNSIVFQVKDSLGNIVLTETDCSDISSLISIQPTDHYKINYVISNSEIVGIDFIKQ